VKVVTLMNTVIWRDQGSEAVRQRLKDAERAEYRKERLVMFKEEDVGGPEMVTTDEDPVLRGVAPPRIILNKRMDE